MVATYNRTKDFTKNFKYDTEKEQEDLMHINADVKTIVQLDGGNEYGITQKQYIINLILMVLLFSCYSFSFWLTDF